MFEGPLPTAATFSKSPKMWSQRFTPPEVLKGYGSRVLCSDEIWRIDYVSGLGANLLGYNHAQFCERVMAQIREGAGFSLPHVLERHVAEKLVAMLGPRVPGWSVEGLAVRFGLSGTDATTMAVRLARAVTGRTRILSSGYHGWGDWSISKTPPAWGIVQPQDVEDFQFGNMMQLFTAMQVSQPAAVIMEHPMQYCPEGWYQGVRDLCNEHGVLLILDEVVTGLRWALGGAAEVYGIEPDIVCLGKALGNGIPISCIVGRREYFEWFARKDPCFVSSTHFGNAVSLAAADAVLDIWNQAGVDHIWMIGQALMDGLRGAGFTVIGHPPRMLIQFPSLAHKTYFTLGMRDRGILWNRPSLPNLAHTIADVEMTVKAAQEITTEMERIDVEALMADRLPMVLFEGR